MEKIILIKYAELNTKKDNINMFLKTLKQNLEKRLCKYDTEITYDKGRMFVKTEDRFDEVEEIVKNTFGIHEVITGYELINNSLEEIEKQTILFVKDLSFKTFKVETKRANKNCPIQSIEFSRQLGGLILKNNDKLTVDVHNPDTTLMIEILDRYTYLYTDKYFGLGGYPVGTQPRGMLMLSGGIDSPVAGYLALKRGVKIDAVYFEAVPHTSLEARNKVIALSKKLCQYTDQIRLHIVPFTNIQEAIYKECNPEYCITIMRRMMYRIMEKLAKRNKGLVIINGESIGQVASQTLTSMSVINSVTNMPVIRPVACLDKLEIIDIAKKIDTYDISILPFEDCCTIFVPKHPVINPNLNECLLNEEKFDYNKMIEDIVNNVMTITITEDKEKEFDDLL